MTRHRGESAPVACDALGNDQETAYREARTARVLLRRTTAPLVHVSPVDVDSPSFIFLLLGVALGY